MEQGRIEPEETGSKKTRIIIAAAVTGFSGIVGQLILLRELLIVYSGNELSIGIILANWLILESLGSVLGGRRADKAASPLAAYGAYALLFSLFLPGMIYATRMLRTILGLSIAQPVGIMPIVYSSLLILLPVSVIHGALFSYGCRVYASISADDASSTGIVYVYETAGTVVGGAVWTFLLIPHVHTWYTAAGVALLNGIVCMLLLIPEWKSGGIAERVWGGAACLLCVTAAAAFAGPADFLHRKSITAQWHPLHIVHYEHSRYSSIAVAEQDGQYTFFLDGIPHIVTPVFDIHHAESFVHIPLLSHADPSKLLILSGGAGGIINEVLKHPTVQHAAYAELDPKLIELVREYSTPLTEREFADPRLDVSNVDGRFMLQTTEETYDVIMIGIDEPADLQTNRFFTYEFFSLANQRLNEAGILVFTVPGSLTYLSEELRDLNASVYHTVTDVFTHVRVIPAEGSNLVLASQDSAVFAMDVERFAKRSVERGINPQVLVPRHIQNTLHPGWMRWYEDFIEGHTQKRNYDFTPLGVFYSVSHWNAVFSPALRGFFRWIGGVQLRSLVFGFAAVISGILILKLRKPRLLGSGVAPTIGTTGFAGMIFDLSLIFAFQAIYGYVFSWIGLLVTAFMAGSAGGAAVVTANLDKIRNHKKLLVRIDVVVMAYTLILPLVFFAFQPLMTAVTVLSVFRAGILLLSFLGGMLIGAQFPLANRIHLSGRREVGSSAGLLYGSDLLGGWIGGMAGGVILLPIFGLFGTCLAAVLVKVCSFLMLAIQPAEINQGR